MTRQTYIDNVENLSAKDLAKGIRNGIVTFSDLRLTGLFDASKQREVRRLLDVYKAEDDAFNNATTIPLLQDYLSKYPYGAYVGRVNDKISQIRRVEQAKRQQEIENIKANINDYTPDEVVDELGEDLLANLCNDLNIDPNVVLNYNSPRLIYNDIPVNSDDVPNGYTDVFFWGIPSSGKTCALSVILSTIKNEFTMAASDTPKKFGATYRDSLINISKNDTGYLPDSTAKDRTQYMPFLFKARSEKNYRKISFFELSGEVFKYFYEIANSTHIVDANDKNDIDKSFQTIDLLLSSNNQKIHFFFIDYNQETRGYSDEHGLTQSNYLEAAATYFRDNNNIFKKKTDAVYVVVTKSDEIHGTNKGEQTKSFLNNNFGSFMDVIKTRCKKDSVNFEVKLFSIGDVYFKRICKVNRAYARAIIDDLLQTVKPAKESKLSTFFNS